MASRNTEGQEARLNTALSLSLEQELSIRCATKINFDK